jgi:hypothetical protein
MLDVIRYTLYIDLVLPRIQRREDYSKGPWLRIGGEAWGEAIIVVHESKIKHVVVARCRNTAYIAGQKIDDLASFDCLMNDEDCW